MKLNPSIKNMSNEYIFFTDQTALTFRICLVYVVPHRYPPDVAFYILVNKYTYRIF